ncbi:MAG: 50S ribosomal protein L23 [bacterium]|nr:50S ribosomal protein L23 [bacterium]
MALFSKKSAAEDTPKKDAAASQSTLVLKEDSGKDDVKDVAEKKMTVRVAVKRYDVPEYSILCRPLITEKNFRMSLAGPKYVYRVATGANKLDIKKAFFNLYGMMPQNVNIVRGGGQEKRFGKVRGTTKLWKKAIITLKKGEKLDDF